jgi:hypothetical protein
VKDSTTGIVKEICTESKVLSAIIINEYGSKFLNTILLERPCNQIFEFQDKENLNDIGFYNYDFKFLDSLRNVTSKSTFDSIIVMPREESFKIVWRYTDTVKGNYFEHLLIENKIGCKRDDETGYTIPVIISNNKLGP